MERPIIKKKELAMQPASKSSTSVSIVSAATKVGSQGSPVEDTKSGPAAMVGEQVSKKRSQDDEPVKPLGSYQVRVGNAQVKDALPLAPAAGFGSAEGLSRAHAQADAHLQAFLRIERESLPPSERSSFVEFLDHGEYGLAYDTAIILMNEGRKWSDASLAHLKAAALAMGIQYPRLAHE